MEITNIMEIDIENDWRAVIKEYIEKGTTPKYELDTKKLRHATTWFMVTNDKLYNITENGSPLRKCITLRKEN